MAEISSGIWRTSKDFDLDANKDESEFDKMVAENVI